MPLDAAVRAGGSLAVAARDGLGGAERWEHGDDPRIGEDFVGWKPPTGSDSTLGIVDFSIFPHLDHELLPENTMADAERWAAGIPGPAYAIDDETAIRVVDGTVEVVSEGHWKLFTPNARLRERTVAREAVGDKDNSVVVTESTPPGSSLADRVDDRRRGTANILCVPRSEHLHHPELVSYVGGMF